MTDEMITTPTEGVAVDAAQPKKIVKPSDKVVTAKGKKRTLKQVPQGRAYIHASFNNTIVTLTDLHGNVIAWASAGNCGFKGPKKATPYAASVVVKKIADKAQIYGLKDLHVFITGIGNGRDGAMRALNGNGFSILALKDTTPVSHNGCRPRRARRM